MDQRSRRSFTKEFKFETVALIRIKAIYGDSRCTYAGRARQPPSQTVSALHMALTSR